MRMTAIGLMLLVSLAWSCPAPAGAGGSLSLEQARELARTNSPTLQLARERLVQAEILIDKAWVTVKPQINATGTYTHTEPSASLAFPDFDSMLNAISFDPVVCQGQPVCFDQSLIEYSRTDIVKQDSFGFTASLYQPLFQARAYTTIQMAKTGYNLAQISTQNLEDYLLHTVDVAYYGALTAQKFLTAASKAVELRREHLKIAQAKFEVGDQPKITVLRAQIDLNQSEQDVKTAENSLALAKEAIALLVGCPPDFALVEPEASRRPPDSLETLLERAQAQRRDLDVARLNLELAERDKQDAWFRFLPSLALTGLFRASDTKGFTGEYYTWNIGLALTIPLYDGGLRYAELEEAESEIRQAQIELEERRRTIRSEIRQLWLSMESAEANLAKARQSLELAQEQAQLSKVSFEAGAITSLEVLDANHIVFLSEVSVAQLELQLQVAVMKLDKAVRMFNPAGSLASGSTGAAAAPTSMSGASLSGSPGGASAAMGGAPAGLGY
jgi:outer membrane protein